MPKFLFWFSMLTVGALGACVETAPASPPGKPYVLSSAEVTEVQRGVRQAMKDPASAQFGNIAAAAKGDGTVTVCGWVNGRNSYGGYSGAMPFAGSYLPKVGLFQLATIATARMAEAAIHVCRQHGVPL